MTLRQLGTQGATSAAYDVLLKRVVDERQKHMLFTSYGHAGCYAVAKRQLGSAMLRAHGLRADDVA